MTNYIHYKLWGEITYSFLIFNGATVEVWKWIIYFILHFTGHVLTYLSILGLKLINASKTGQIFKPVNAYI